MVPKKGPEGSKNGSKMGPKMTKIKFSARNLRFQLDIHFHKWWYDLNLKLSKFDSMLPKRVQKKYFCFTSAIFTFQCTFWALAFEPVKLQKCTICQKNHWSIINLAYFMLFVSKVVKSSQKLAIYQSHIIWNSH